MRYKGRLVAALVLAAASVALTMYLPILIGQAIDCIISAGNVNFDRLIYLLVKSGVLALLTGIFTWIMNILYNNIAFNVVRDIRRDAIDKIKKMQKASEITEDDLKNGEDELQKITDEFIKEIDAAASTKEKEVMSI